MAVFYFNATIISASSGASAVASAAYRHATRMHSETKGIERDYAGKARELVHEEIILPADAPKWAVERYGEGGVAEASERLWNDVEKREGINKRWAQSAQYSRSLTVALPVELNHGERVALLRDYLTDNFAARGMVVDFVVHDIPGNPHSHIMLSMRRLQEDGWGLKDRSWNNRALAVDWRKGWAEYANAALERAGFEQRIDHRTLEAQGIELEPEGYNPHVAAHAEAAGDVAREKARAEEARARNRAYLIENPEHILVVLSAQKTVFSADDIYAALEKRLGVADATRAMGRVMASRELAQMGQTGQRGEALYSTRTQQRIEAGMLTQALDLAGQRLELAEGQGGEALSDTLNKGQAAAAAAMLSPERLTLVTGYAGTGKTFTLREVTRVWRARGYEVIGGAISGKASQELDGIVGLTAASLAAWEARWANGQLPEGPFVFVMDEAGMVGSNNWARVQARVAEMGGKMIAVGDAEQLQPVAAGSAFKEIQDKIGSSVIDFVVRQRDREDRLATHDLAVGGVDKIGRALGHYHAKGAIHFGENRATAMEAIAVRYFDGEAPQGRIALAHRNKDVDVLNALIRDEAMARGVIDPSAAVTYTRARPEGVLAEDWLKTSEASRTLTLAPGDRVRFTRPERENGVQRSAFGTVERATAEALVVKVDVDGVPTRDVRLDPRRFLDLDYGYAATVHKSQGMTMDRAYMLASGTLNQHLLYVGLSRHREHVELHVPKSEIAGPAQLVKIGARKGYMTLTDGHEGFDREVAPSSIASAHAALPELADRADVAAPGASGARVGGFADPELVQVATRTAGLLSADYLPGQLPLGDDPKGYADNPRKLVDDLLSRRSALSAQDVARGLSDVVRDPDTFQRLFFEAMSHPDLVVVTERGGAGGERLYSTPGQVRDELVLADRALGLAHRGDAAAIDYDVSRFSLNEGQRTALDHIAQGRGLSVLTGPGGSGVTWTLGAARDVYAAAGFDVIGLAPTGAGVDALRKVGGMEPMTFAAFTRRITEGRVALTSKSVVMLDQAERLGVRDMDALLAGVEAAGARVVLASSAYSQAPMEAGAAFRIIAEREGAAELDAVERQRSAGDRQAAADLAAGGARARAAVGHYIDAGQVIAAGQGGDLAGAAMTALAEGFAADPAAQKIALTQSMADATALNAAIRTALRARVPEEERTAEVIYARGEGLDPLALAEGDRLSFRQGLYDLALRAGATAEVVRAAPEAVTLAVGQGDARQLVRLAPAHLAGADYGYATTVHRAPSDGIASVHVLATGGMDHATASRAFTRHRDALRIYVPRADMAGARDQLDAMVTRVQPERSAIDALTDKGAGLRAALDALARPERSAAEARTVRGTLGGFLERANIWVDDRLWRGRGGAVLDRAADRAHDRARSVEELKTRFFEGGMQPYGPSDDAFRRDPASFAEALRVEVRHGPERENDMARYHRANLGRLWYNLEGKVPGGGVSDTLDAAAVTLASPRFYRKVLAELPARERAEVRQLTRAFAQFIHGADFEPTQRTKAMAALYTVFDATGRTEARDMLGRMLHEDYRHLLPDMARERGMDPADARAVFERRKDMAIDRDTDLGRTQRARGRDIDRDRGMSMF